MKEKTKLRKQIEVIIKIKVHGPGRKFEPIAGSLVSKSVGLGEQKLSGLANLFEGLEFGNLLGGFLRANQGQNIFQRNNHIHYLLWGSNRHPGVPLENVDGPFGCRGRSVAHVVPVI